MTHKSQVRGDGRATGASLVAALEQAWGEIRDRHPEVPAAVIVTGSGSNARGGSLRFGHFAAARWRHAVDQAQVPEVFVGGEGLERGAAPVLATLLHEAAHAVAAVRGIKDTSLRAGTTTAASRR